MEPQDLVQEIQFTNGYVNIKFGRSIKTSTITNDKFVVATVTPSAEVTNPFKEISLPDDYNSISRILHLFWGDSVLTANTSYTFTITGLEDAAGAAIEDSEFTFSTGDSLALSENDATPTPVEFTIVDYSINTEAFSAVVTPTVSEEDYLVVTETDPVDGDYYLPASYNNGRVTITFDDAMSLSNLTSSLFKVQRREITRGPTRWETVDAELSASDDQTEVYVDFPSTDDEPVYNTEDSEYFETNYKYRIIVSNSIIEEAATPHISMLEDYVLTFAGVLDPLYLNPDEVGLIYPDISPLEIAEAVFVVSSEVKQTLKLNDTQVPSYLGLDYIKAAAICSLSKIYDPTSGVQNTVQLADLSVTTNSNSSNAITRATATTWCELAAVLRREMLYSSVGMKATMKAANYVNPIPERKLKRYIDNTFVPDSSLN